MNTKNNIYLDDIIYRLQRYGGISTFWHEITSRISSDILFNVIRFTGTKISRYIPVRVEAGIFHSSYYRLPLSNRALSVVTVHDFIYELGFLRQLHSFINVLQLKLAINRANVIVCVSENTKQDLLQIYPKLVRDADIYVIPHGTTFAYNSHLNINVPARLSFVNKFIRYKYIIFIGKRFSYKNFDIAFCAFAHSLLPKLGFKMLCVGEPFSQNEKLLFEKFSLGSSLIAISNVNNIELTYLYQNAFALLYSSLYEGFGLPPLEAMSCGCPVVASNKSSIPEVVGEAGLLVNPCDIESITSALHQLLDPNLRNSFIQKGMSRSELFSWDVAAEKYKRIYKSLI